MSTADTFAILVALALLANNTVRDTDGMATEVCKRAVAVLCIYQAILLAAGYSP